MTFSEAATIMMSKNKNIVMTERVKAIDEAPILGVIPFEENGWTFVFKKVDALSWPVYNGARRYSTHYNEWKTYKYLIYTPFISCLYKGSQYKWSIIDYNGSAKWVTEENDSYWSLVSGYDDPLFYNHKQALRGVATGEDPNIAFTPNIVRDLKLEFRGYPNPSSTKTEPRIYLSYSYDQQSTAYDSNGVATDIWYYRDATANWYVDILSGINDIADPDNLEEDINDLIRAIVNYDKG